MHKKPPVPVQIILVIAILVGGYYGVKALIGDRNNQLSVSGTIEATEIIISPEIPGKVIEIFISEGVSVSEGMPLFRLDDSVLKAQKVQSESNLMAAQATVKSAEAARETARANYDLALIAARVDSVSSRTSDWIPSNLGGYSVPGGYFTGQELQDASAIEVVKAKADLDSALSVLSNQLAESDAMDFVTVEKELLETRVAEQAAADVLNRAKLTSNQELIDAAQAVFNDALERMITAQDAYDNYTDTQISQEILTLRIAVSIQQERYESAQDRLLQQQVGESSPKLKAAMAALNQAELAVAQALTVVAQAEAQMKLLDVQIEKLTIYSPTDGVVLTRKIQPGEMVAVGASALTLGKLDELTIIVYVPEDVYGTLALNQSASLMVDSYPGEKFQGRISRIADQAEFTPRNVQTIEGRKATVFAIELVVDDPQGKLKPGMPADVVFDE